MNHVPRTPFITVLVMTKARRITARPTQAANRAFFALRIWLGSSWEVAYINPAIMMAITAIIPPHI